MLVPTFLTLLMRIEGSQPVGSPIQVFTEQTVAKLATKVHHLYHVPMNLGRFGPIPVQSGRFSPISWVSRFGPTGGGGGGGGSFWPSFKGGLFRPDFRGESFQPDLFIYFGKTGKILG